MTRPATAQQKKRKVRKENIVLAKLRKAIEPLKAGGDNFRFVGYGRVRITFLGRPPQ